MFLSIYLSIYLSIVMQSQTNALANSSMSSDSEGLMIVQVGSTKRQYSETDFEREKKKAKEKRVTKALEEAVVTQYLELYILSSLIYPFYFIESLFDPHFCAGPSFYQHYFLKWDHLLLLLSFPMLLNPIFSYSLGLRLMLASGNVLRV